MRVRDARIEATAAGPSGFPPPDVPEVAFLGRSNVGKSSLLNALVGRRQLARTSGTPGKTRLIHFYRVERGSDSLRLVDLPGYGYARVSKRERAGWQGLVESYLDGRSALRAAVLLQDLRRDPGEDETLLLAWLAERGVPALVALTKCDKLKRGARGQRVAALRRELPLAPERVVETSAAKREGIEALWKVLDGFLG
ncbi:MAG: ribosome biogenesis GTP-binding protein YihA/YsxC [Myxococcota bacterium]|nr:ribosome biogenesis GTP-binding protein YihA/YsxC [Myxococcota bacterium]